MIVGRPLMLVFALMLCMTATLAPRQASAHAGHQPVSLAAQDQQQTRRVTVVSVYDQGLADEMNRQCGAQMCCGSACSSTGYVIAGESVFPEPAEGVSLIAPPSGPRGSGIGPAGIKRPPRI